MTEFSNSFKVSRRLRSVLSGALVNPEPGERNSGWPKATYRCSTFRNSRTFPGQSYATRISIVRPGTMEIPDGALILIVSFQPVAQRISADTEHSGGFDLVVAAFFQNPQDDRLFHGINDIGMNSFFG